MKTEFVAFVFAHLNKPSMTSREYIKLPIVIEQWDSICNHTIRTKSNIVHAELGFQSNKNFAFTQCCQFDAAIKLADQKGLYILLDLPCLLKMSSPARIGQILQRIRRVSAPIIDCVSQECIQKMPMDQLILMLNYIIHERHAHSRLIKRGLGKQDTAKPPVPVSTRQKGNRVRTAIANANANQYQSFIKDLIDQKTDGSRVTPAEVMRALNKTGRFTPRGKPWSYNSTKNMMKRLGLTGTDDKSPESKE